LVFGGVFFWFFFFFFFLQDWLNSIQYKTKPRDLDEIQKKEN